MKKIAFVFLVLIAVVGIWLLSAPTPEVPIPNTSAPQVLKPEAAPVAVKKMIVHPSIQVKDGWGYHFTFVEESTGELISGVSTQLLWKEGDERKTKDLNNDTHVGFVEVSKELHEFSLKFSHPTHYSEHRTYKVSLSPENPTATLEVLMILGETIAGRVYDAATDEGIAGVKVGLGRRKSPGAVTDESGNYRLGGVRTGSKQIFLDHAKGYIDPPNMENGSSVDIRKGQALTGVDFALEKGVFTTIKGKVLDAEGKSVSGAKVDTISYNDTMTEYQTAEDVSAADGSFSLEELQVDDGFYVTAQSKGYISAPVGPLSLSAEGIEDLELKLIPTGSISGVVVDVNTGKPVPEPSFLVKMMYAWRGRYIAGGHPTNLNEEGRFTIPELAPGKYGLYLDAYPKVFHSGWIKAQVEVELKAGEHIEDVKLTFDYEQYLTTKMNREVKKATQTPMTKPKPIRFPEVKGQIVRAGTSDPVTTFNLSIVHKTMGETRSQRSIQNPEGRFTIRETQGHTLVLDISAKGYAPQRVTYTLDKPDDFKSPLVIALEPGAELAGRVLDANGKAIAGAKVYIGYNPALSNNGSTTHPADAISAPDGSFSLNTLTDSATRIYAQHPIYAVGFEDITPTREHSNTLDIVLNAGGVIEGIIRLNGEPLSGQFFMALDDTRTNIGLGNNNTDKDGRYRIPQLAPGEYTVYTNIDDFNRTVKVIAEVAEGMVTEADINFDDSQNTLSGSVTLNGEKNPSLSVHIEMQSATGIESISTHSTGTGEYSIVNIFATLRDGSRGKDTFPLTIQEGAYTQDLQLTSE